MARKGAEGFWALRLGVPVVVHLSWLSTPRRRCSGAGGRAASPDSPTMVRYEFTHPGSGPMWFVVALLGFLVTYAVVAAVPPGAVDADRLPRRRHLVTAAAVIVAASFVVRFVWPFAGNPPLALNLWEWPQKNSRCSPSAPSPRRNAAGLTRRRRVSAYLPTRGKAPRVAVLAVGVPIAASDDPEPFLGGWHLPGARRTDLQGDDRGELDVVLGRHYRTPRHVTWEPRAARWATRPTQRTSFMRRDIVALERRNFRDRRRGGGQVRQPLQAWEFAASYTLGWLVTRPHRRQRRT